MNLISSVIDDVIVHLIDMLIWPTSVMFELMSLLMLLIV